MDPIIPENPVPNLEAISNTEMKEPQVESIEAIPVVKTTPITKKRNKSKRRSKSSRDANAPKHPLTGYIRYMNENRETVRLRNPNAGANEITKLVAEEWTTLPEDKKKPYLEAAEIDKERYNKEFIEYTESKRLMILKTEEMEREKEKEKAVVSPEKPAIEVGKELIKEIRSMDYDIPIFTDDFLEHNKTVDTELRLMRKSNIDFEQQNSVLEKLVENMHNGIDKLNRETKQLSNENAMLESYLHKLKSTLVTALESLPGETNETTTVTSENIEKYMQDLHNMISTTPHVNVLNKAKDIIQKLDFQSLNV